VWVRQNSVQFYIERLLRRVPEDGRSRGKSWPMQEFCAINLTY
jgi:hypothetical protein